ncbi:MAG: DUF5667 domain-containing protein [Candidatus Pacebacteria bacterium]|nr:DUF5667 domain-containing protein [Candidatus Paceibacterota bacterium]
MKPLKITFSIFGLFVASAVLAVSLASSVPSAYSAGDKFKSNDKQFYLNGEILPDHTLYPVVMAADKLKLEMANPQEKINIYTTYANLRLSAVESLLEKDNPQLALTTLTKSQKYLLRAASETINQDSSQATKLHVLKTLLYHTNKHQQLKEQFSAEEKNIIDQLDMECLVFVDSLKTSLIL